MQQRQLHAIVSIIQEQNKVKKGDQIPNLANKQDNDFEKTDTPRKNENP